MNETRKEAIENLQEFGISGPLVYLVDLIPLIEIMWADGKVQAGELEVLNSYLDTHVERINKTAGCQVLTLEQAHAFIQQFLNARPDPRLLKCLRSLVNPVRLTGSDQESNQALRRSLLSACLDIAASSVCEYPYGLGDRFNAEEKRSFFEIIDSLTASPSGKKPSDV